MHELMHVNYHRVHGKKDQNNPALLYLLTFVNAVQVPVQDSKYRQALKAQLRYHISNLDKYNYIKVKSAVL